MKLKEEHIKKEVLTDSKNEENDDNTDNPNKSISISFNLSNPRGRPKTRHRDSKKMKACKQDMVQMKMKAEQHIKKAESKNTLEYFLSEKNQVRENQSIINNELLNESKATESIYNENEAINVNDIYITVFKSNELSDNPKVNFGLRKVIGLKDMMFYLERNRLTACHHIILYKLISKING